MLVLRHHLAIAGIVIVAAVAVPAAGLASGFASPSGKPPPPQASAPSLSKSGVAQSEPTTLAASAGISVSQLQAGLAAAKQAGGDTAAGNAAFAASTGVSHATAQRVLNSVWESSPPGKPAAAVSASKSAAARSVTVPEAVRALATRLAVSISAAERAFKQIAASTNQSGSVDAASPAFAAIARDLGVSPARLADAWDAVRQSVADK